MSTKFLQNYDVVLQTLLFFGKLEQIRVVLTASRVFVTVFSQHSNMVLRSLGQQNKKPLEDATSLAKLQRSTLKSGELQPIEIERIGGITWIFVLKKMINNAYVVSELEELFTKR